MLSKILLYCFFRHLKVFNSVVTHFLNEKSNSDQEENLLCMSVFKGTVDTYGWMLLVLSSIY